jgi:type 1 glutamine amidotransferase
MKDTRDTGKYSITLVLPKGSHEYKFIINGNWVVDPECQNWVRNSLGTLNSVIKVD